MPRRTLARILLSALILGPIVPLAFAKPGVVKTKDGRTIEGDVNEKGDGSVVITTKAGMGVTLQATQVGSISYAENVQAAYQQRVAAMPANAPAKDHVDLARWLYEQRSYDLARQELAKAQAKEPNNADAAMLMQTIDRSASWDRARPPAGTGAGTTTPRAGAGGTNPPAGAGARGGTGAAHPKHVLTPEQINVIKQQELQRTDGAVRLRFENDVIRKVVPMANGMTVQQVQALSDFEKMMLVYEKGDPDMRKDVKIVNDPGSLLRFKQRVQATVLGGCAATNCHGPTHQGKFVLQSPPGGDPGTYTNFYILSQMKVAGPDGSEIGRMINRTYPDKSVLLQMGLPRQMAEIDHPEVQGWKETFRGTNDPKYLEVQDWIKNSLVTLEPNYGIDFALPGQPAGAAAPAPAPAPAPQAQQTPQPARGANPQPQPNQKPAEGTAEDALKNARERMRPIRGL